MVHVTTATPTTAATSTAPWRTAPIHGVRHVRVDPPGVGMETRSAVLGAGFRTQIQPPILTPEPSPLSPRPSPLDGCSRGFLLPVPRALGLASLPGLGPDAAGPGEPDPEADHERLFAWPQPAGGPQVVDQ